MSVSQKRRNLGGRKFKEISNFLASRGRIPVIVHGMVLTNKVQLPNIDVQLPFRSSHAHTHLQVAANGAFLESRPEAVAAGVMKAAFSSIFGKKKPLKEILRENKRTITRAVRDIDREKTNLEKQEKKLIGEIKKNAKAGQMGAVKVRTRLTAYSMLKLKTNIRPSTLSELFE